MGVQGLWKILNTAGQSRSLTHLTVVDGFERNESGRRAYRIGIDVSIWFYHVLSSQGNVNSARRTLFFRIRNIARLPIIPLFMFDGCERPKVKRGSKMGKSGSHSLTADFKRLLDVFGMEWRTALGEAEAELAHLNQIGVIDAVMTDDVDALVFGACTVMKNSSLNLLGNRPCPALDSEGKPSKHHVMVYTAESIRTHPAVSLTRGGLILFVILSGGDYDNGLKGFGPQISHALARLGYGDQLLDAYEQRCQQNILPFLAQWRADINTELRTNAHGLLRYSHPSLHIPDNFPSMQTLEKYVNPLSSSCIGCQNGVALRDNRDLNIPKVAAFCEDHFNDWGYRSAIIMRFRNLLWEAAVICILRRAALEADEKEKTRRTEAGRIDLTIKGPLKPSVEDAVGTPTSLVKRYLNRGNVDRRAASCMKTYDSTPLSAHEREPNPLIKRIVGCRQHVSTDKLLEYRVEVDPAQLIALAHSGIKGRRPELGGNVGSTYALDDLPESMVGNLQCSEQGSRTPDPNSMMKLWLPASIMRQVHPGLVQNFEAVEEARRTRKATSGRVKKKRTKEDKDDSTDVEMKGLLIKPSVRGARKAIVEEGGSASHRVPVHPVTAAAIHRRRQDVNILAECSLPTRKCGFLFTIPDPDDPDQLNTEGDDAAYPMPSQQAASETANIWDGFADSSTSASKEKTKAPVRRMSQKDPVPAMCETPTIGHDHDLGKGVLGKHATTIDRNLSVSVTQSIATISRENRTRIAEYAPQTVRDRGTAKRKRAMQGSTINDDHPLLLTTNIAIAAPYSRVPSTNQPRASSSSNTGLSSVPFLSRSPINRTVSHWQSQHPGVAPLDNVNVIELDSDEEDVALQKDQEPATKKCRYDPSAEPSSFHESALSYSGLWQDATVLT